MPVALPIDLRPMLTLALQPVTACGSHQPLAWHAVATARDGQSFDAAAAALPSEQRPALEAARIALAVEAAIHAGLQCDGGRLVIPVNASAGMAEGLLDKLFHLALAWRFPVDRIAVAINADEGADLDSAVALAQACTARGIAIALDDFAAGPIALRLLGRFAPCLVTLAPTLVRNIAASPSRRSIMESVLRLARGMDVTVAARGAVSSQDYAALGALGLRHFQLDMAALPPATPPRRDPRASNTAHRRMQPAARSPRLAVAI